MRFAEPYNFILLIGVLLVGAYMFWALARKKKLLQRFGDLPLLMRMSPYISFPRQRTKIILLILALGFVVLALARLQFGTHLELLKREGIDIMVALDVSNSMLAEDIKPNRLEKAKQELRSIIDRLKGDRIGIIVFAGEAFIQCPLTLDYGAAKMLLQAADNTSVSIQGTSIRSAVEATAKSFDPKEKSHKVLLLLTDGEDLEGGADKAAEEARTQGIKIYTVGIGLPTGQPIPIFNQTGQQIGFKKDENGEVVISKLDETTLQKIALATGGKYYNVTAGEMELDRIFDEVSKMEKKELEGTLVTKYDDRFQWPLLVALLLIILEFYVPERKKPAGARTNA
jgi:Ca-activated chloride channel family protein